MARCAGASRTSYATDLRIFATRCRQADLRLLTVKRSHLELFGRWMEETGRMRSTVARRLSTLTSFLASLLALNGLRISEALGADVATWTSSVGTER